MQLTLRARVVVARAYIHHRFDQHQEGIPVSQSYLIWSDLHCGYWRPNLAGYTVHIEAARLYSKADAEKAVDGLESGHSRVIPLREKQLDLLQAKSRAELQEHLLGRLCDLIIKEAFEEIQEKYGGNSAIQSLIKNKESELKNGD